MSGAAVLCGSGALRGGAGLVQVVSPADVQSTVAAGNPCYLTAPLPVDVQGHLAEDAIPVILELSGAASALAIGPGLGQSGKIAEIIEFVLRQVAIPVVLDADGLNALAKLPVDAFRLREAPSVLTPHPGEFARLTRTTTEHVQENREQLAVALAAERRVVLVLKGHGTLVTDGNRLYRNTTGNPGMASGGTGDVLTGLIAALIGQGLSPFDAAVLGVWTHGRAGDLAAAELGQTGLIAQDLLTYLPKALREHTG
jgi:ADP-dependent NAD(P)H-hydrate dehydratase